MKPLCLGIIVGSHGVRGLVRIKSFTAVPADVAAYGPLHDEAGTRSFVLEIVGQHKGVVLAAVDGVADRDAAEALKGISLYVERARLPAPEEEQFYHADLIGLEAVLADGTLLGKVATVHDYGAGESLEVRPAAGPAVLVPFTRTAVPVIDLAGGRLTIEPPDGLFGGPAGAESDDTATAEERR